MPVNVFGRRADVGGVAYQVLGALADATVELGGPTAARVRGRLPGSGAPVTVELTTDHLRGPGGDRQRDGMVAWLARPAIDGSGRDAATAMVADLHLSMAFQLADDAGQAEVDEVVGLAIRAAEWSDGMVVAMASGVVLGPDGAVWLEPASTPAPAESPAAPLGPDPDAAADDFVRQARQVLDDEGVPDGGVVLDAALADAVPAPEPPAAARVGQRLVVTAAVAARALTEVDGDHLGEARAALLDWVEGTGAAAELDGWEAALLAAEPGAVPERDRIDGSWRLEAAVVLGWSLGLVDLPPPDVGADPGVVFAAVGLADSGRTTVTLENARRRDLVPLEHLRRQLLTVHWRLVEHRRAPGAVVLAEVVADHPWGPLTVDGLPLVDGDLAIDGRAVTDADPDVVRRAASIVQERYRAAAWLVEGGPYPAPARNES